MCDEHDDAQPTYDEWMEGWEAAVLDGQSSISRAEAERRWRQEHPSDPWK